MRLRPLTIESPPAGALDALSHAAACLERGALGEAEHHCREILKAAPHHAPGRLLLGKVLQAAGRTGEAQAEFRAVVQAEPENVDAWLQLAAVLQAQGQIQKAEECLRAALGHLPNAFPIHNDLALILLAQGNLKSAGRHLERALELNPQSAIALCNLGIIYKGQGNIDRAVDAYRRAIAVNPRIPEAHNNLGDALKDRDLPGAAQAFRTAITMRPDFPEALDNLGVVYFFQGLLPEALEQFDRALALRPDFHRATGHKTTTLFLMGRLPEAWKLHRHRFVVAGFKIPPHGRFPVPVWNGEPLAGKALLVWTDLGLGEEILQAGMLPDALDVVSRLTVECSPRLESLFRRSFPQATIIPRTNPTRACPVAVNADYQIAGGDLGAAFRADLSKFPRHSGYLKANPLEVAAIRKRYRKTPGSLVVGLSWASHRSSHSTEKTLALAEFSPILRQSGVVFVNLQYACVPEEIAAVSQALGVEIITDELVDPAGDIDAVASQIAAMDLVIAVSNTAVHIAGALNVPVWNIVPAFNASGMWHWFSDSHESSWYPSMKIYRRTSKTNDAVLERLAADLRDWVRARTLERS